MCIDVTKGFGELSKINKHYEDIDLILVLTKVCIYKNLKMSTIA